MANRARSFGNLLKIELHPDLFLQHDLLEYGQRPEIQSRASFNCQRPQASRDQDRARL